MNAVELAAQSETGLMVEELQGPLRGPTPSAMRGTPVS